MTRKSVKVFLDTRVWFAAVLSPTSGARKLFLLGEAELLELTIGPHVLHEADEVVCRKAPASLPRLAQWLEVGNVQTVSAPISTQIEAARRMAAYAPDTRVLAEAIHAKVDWIATHDKEHFLKSKTSARLPFPIRTAGDLLQKFKDEFYLP